MIKVLIIEDNQDIQENTKELLELAGYEVLVSSDGDGGLKTIIEIMPDIVLCDIVMPRVDGYTVLQRVKENNKTSHIPFIFFSANAEKKDIDYAISLGISGYLTKPFEFEALTSMIKQNINISTNTYK